MKTIQRKKFQNKNEIKVRNKNEIINEKYFKIKFSGKKKIYKEIKKSKYF